ncbi:hypothetical protein Tco_1280492 [Tanacetum coccineum]
MKLTGERPTKTDIRLSLASHSYIYPLGIAKDVLVEPVDFVILDIKENEKRPFILGIPFLIMAKVAIKFDKGTITLRSGNSKISFYRIPDSLCMIEKGFMRYVDTKPNKDQLRHCIEKGPYILIELVTPAVLVDGDNQGQPQQVREETYIKTTPENKKLIDAKAEAIHMILNGIEDNIYSTVDPCSSAKEMWEAIERLQLKRHFPDSKIDQKLKLFAQPHDRE